MLIEMGQNFISKFVKQRELYRKKMAKAFTESLIMLLERKKT